MEEGKRHETNLVWRRARVGSGRVVGIFSSFFFGLSGSRVFVALELKGLLAPRAWFEQDVVAGRGLLQMCRLERTTSI